uniref:Uncharacterized protein n=1 Tax=Rhizophora mucronata TaxID=61149 RepID=A0A2P2PS76_RHIMU
MMNVKQVFIGWTRLGGYCCQRSVNRILIYNCSSNVDGIELP